MINRRDVLAGSLGALAFSAAGSSAVQAKDAPGVTEAAITVGVLSVLTGPVALQGVPIANGVDAYFKNLNEMGGSSNREITILKRDHQYNGQTANQIFAEMTPRVAIYADLFGTPIIAALQRRIKQANILVVPSTFGSPFYSDPQLIVPFAPYPIQISAGIDFLVKEKNGKSLKWAIVERHDNLGADGVAAFDFATKHYGLEVVAKQTYEPSDTDFTAQIQALKDSGANAVVLANTSAVSAQFVVGLARLGVHATWLGWQPSFDPGLAKNKEFMSIVAQDKFYIGSCLPAWSTQAPEMTKVREVKEKYFPDQAPDPYFTFGYIHGAITNAVLSAAIKSGDLTRTGINAAVKDVGTTDLNGLLTNPVNFAEPPQKRFPRAVQIWEVSESDPSFQAPVTDYFIGESASKYPMPGA
ncbi:ABC-type branched-subunit amino acid transport system substrate-binding protein [Rhodoligotrophos appendicifer]|uniref:ABC transporter substrate-binding protein n=1 Tax=Rhodoligotrophos appendicifer TaxID=987056 RepID=UPI001478BFE3|nr:ABC transporter substrate-binding protein [Rhodoligotrophos appendicifer]